MSQNCSFLKFSPLGRSTSSRCRMSFLCAVYFPSLYIDQRTSDGGQVVPPETKDVATGTSCKLVDAPLHELEDKLKSKMKELHGLAWYKSKNEHKRKLLREHFELRDLKIPSLGGFIRSLYKIETWYFLTKKEAMLHILFEKYVESCSFIKHDSTPATVTSEIQEPLFKYLPEELIKTGVQRRINRLKKLKEIEIFMRFTVDMIKISHTLRDRPFVDMCVSIKKDKRFSYLDYLDNDTFRVGFKKFMVLLPCPPYDNIEHMMRTLERGLNDWFTSKYRSILMCGEIVENDVVYYNAFNELEKESGKPGFGDLEGSCDKQARISMAVSDNQWSEVEEQEETIDEVNDIKKSGKMDQNFGLHKWTIEVDCNSKLTAKVTLQTRHGEILSGLPESGFVRRAPNTYKTKRERLQSQIYIIEQEIVGQEDIASKYDFKKASSKEASKDDDNMIQVKLGETSSDVHKVKLEEKKL